MGSQTPLVAAHDPRGRVCHGTENQDTKILLELSSNRTFMALDQNPLSVVTRNLSFLSCTLQNTWLHFARI